eukprot:Skav226781  [mRNA]  locus=scaffold8:308444:309499:- [translate_table: standard]
MYKVLPYLDLKKNGIEAMLDQIEAHLRGAIEPVVWLHISCHSQTVCGCPQFLPADAGRWGDGVSIFELVGKVSSFVQHARARIHVTVNGCMDFPSRFERLVWFCRYGWREDGGCSQ